MKTILLGIDGGASKTTLIAADENLNILGGEAGGGSNYLSIGLNKAVDNLARLIQKAVNSIDAEKADYCITIGTAGAGREDDVDKLTNGLTESLQHTNISCNNILVVSDAVIALEGALNGKAGVIVNCGTGSFVFGKDEAGNIHRAGGFGRLIGDEGSGYSIGRLGINLISKMMDGRIPRSKLYNAFLRKFSIKDSVNLINSVYKGGFDIPSIAPLVINCADEDRLCQSILDSESDEIILHLEAIKNKINMSIFDLVLMGSLIKADNYYSSVLKEKIGKSFPEIKIINPVSAPEYGALLLSHKMLSK